MTEPRRSATGGRPVLLNDQRWTITEKVLTLLAASLAVLAAGIGAWGTRVTVEREELEEKARSLEQVNQGLEVELQEAGSNHDAEFGFQCQVPQQGYGSCTGDRVDVPLGRYVRVKNTTTSSTGSEVRFRLYNTDGNHLLGTSVAAGQDEVAFIWRNDTDRTINVEFTAEVIGNGSLCSARAFVTNG